MSPRTAARFLTSRWLRWLRSLPNRCLFPWRYAIKQFRDLKNKRAESGWQPYSISLAGIISVVLAELGIISTIVALTVVSARHSGFVTLIDQPEFTISLEQISPNVLPGFLYHSLPTLLMTIYCSLKAATLGAVWERQPFVELARGKENASNCEKTILLDYSKDAWKRVYVAWRNRHYIILACAVVTVLNTLGMAALTSYLFTSVQINTNTTILGIQEVSFNQYNLNLSDARPTLDTVTAIEIYGARQPAWTAAKYVFGPFKANSTSTNVTTESLGYSANIDCRVLPPDEYVIQAGNDTFNISAEDRGCNVSEQFNLPVAQGSYLWTDYSGCSWESVPSRLLLLAWNSPSTTPNPPSNLSFVSCQPTYWNTSGNLTVDFGSPTQGSIISFIPSNTVKATQILFLPRSLYEQGLQGIRTFDSLTNLSANDFGRLLYSVASKEKPSSPLDAKNLAVCAEALWASIFAVFASGDLFTPLSPSQTIPLLAAVPVTRLLIVQPLAYALLAILTINLVLTILLVGYTGQKSIQSEELKGLLGAAVLLESSKELIKAVHDAKEQATVGKSVDPWFIGKIMSHMRETHKESSCYWLERDEENGPRIMLRLKTDIGD